MFFLEIQASKILETCLHGLKTVAPRLQHLRLIVPYFMLLLGHSLQFLSLRFDPSIGEDVLLR